jgi:hypothetical protein
MRSARTFKFILLKAMREIRSAAEMYESINKTSARYTVQYMPWVKFILLPKLIRIGSKYVIGYHVVMLSDNNVMLMDNIMKFDITLSDKLMLSNKPNVIFYS